MDYRIIGYEPKFKSAFKELNVLWISKYFELEKMDILQLDNPEEYILSKGGKIFFAQSGDEIIGTVALKKESENVYELSKMAVSERFQGLGIGKRMGEHVIEQAKNLGCKILYLESNTKLEPAIRLYEKLGFVEVPLKDSPFSRANFRAEIHFKDSD